MKNSDYYVGQEVICVDDVLPIAEPLLKKGNTYTIKSLTIKCCNDLLVDVGIPLNCLVRCDCGNDLSTKDGIRWFRASRFKPKDSMQVVEHLLEVKKEQLS